MEKFVQFSDTILKPDQFSDLKRPETKQICLVFRRHLKTGPFTIRTHFNHLKTGLVRYSDSYCIFNIPWKRNNPEPGQNTATQFESSLFQLFRSPLKRSNYYVNEPPKPPKHEKPIFSTIRYHCKTTSNYYLPEASEAYKIEGFSDTFPSIWIPLYPYCYTLA